MQLDNIICITHSPKHIELSHISQTIGSSTMRPEKQQQQQQYSQSNLQIPGSAALKLSIDNAQYYYQPQPSVPYGAQYSAPKYGHHAPQ